MKNLIYIDVESFAPNKLTSKLKYLFFELAFFFDGSDRLRDLGFEIGIKLFGTSTLGFNSKLLTFKGYYAFYLRIIMLLIIISVAILILEFGVGPLAIILPAAMIMGGLAFFNSFLNHKELEIIDKAHDRFLKKIIDRPLPPVTSIGVICNR